MTKGVLEQLEMCRLVAAGAEAARRLLGYGLQVTEVCAVMLQMAQMVAMEVHA